MNNIFENLESSFSIIVVHNNQILAVTDKIRSYPILYSTKKVNEKLKLYIFDDLSSFKKSNLKKSFNNFQILNFATSGYTTENKTIYNNVFQINPGSYLKFYKNNIYNIHYTKWNFSVDKKKYKRKSLLKDLNNANKKVIKNLIKSSEGRCIAIPLSAGIDSRFILSGLVEYGYKNIITFSYGRRNNREAKVASQIAKKLKVPWFYIEYDNLSMRKTFLSKEYLNFIKYSDNLTSVCFLQDYFAINFLKNNKIIPDSSIIVNGQTGDFISGNHIPKNKFFQII